MILALYMAAAAFRPIGSIRTDCVIGSAAGIRLLRERGTRRLLPWASLLVSLAILPFIGIVLAVSLAIALVGVVYSWIRTGRQV